MREYQSEGHHLEQKSHLELTKSFAIKHFSNVLKAMEFGRKINPSLISYINNLPPLHIAINGNAQATINFDINQDDCIDINEHLLHYDEEDRKIINGNGAKLEAKDPVAFASPELDSKVYYLISVFENLLTKESQDSQIDERTLLETLVVHELVHFLMHANKAENLFRSRKHFEDFMGKPCRHIHESCALHVCNQLGKNGILNRDAVQKYLNHVQAASENRAEGEFYIGYFSDFRNMNDDDFWPTISKHNCFAVSEQ